MSIYCTSHQFLSFYARVQFLTINDIKFSHCCFPLFSNFTLELVFFFVLPSSLHTISPILSIETWVKQFENQNFVPHQYLKHRWDEVPLKPDIDSCYWNHWFSQRSYIKLISNSQNIMRFLFSVIVCISSFAFNLSMVVLL